MTENPPPLAAAEPDPASTTAATGADGMALASEGKTSLRKVIAWAFWDWGTQPYYTVITTFVFAVYLAGEKFASYDASGVLDLNGPTVAISRAGVVGAVFIALIAPVLGQSSDRRGNTVRILRILTWTLVAISGLLYFVKPHPSYLLLGLVLLTAGTVIGEIANVNYYSMIDQVASQKNVGRVSGFGWGMGYLGGILVLLVIYFVFISPEVGLFGVTSEEGADIRVSMLVCALWTLVFTIPTFIALRDRPSPADDTNRLGIVGSYKALFRHIVAIWKTQRHTAYFLIASALFRDGLAGIFSFGAIVASVSFGFSSGDIIVFGAAANLIAGLVTMLFGLLDDKIGPKKVILICLGILIAGGISVVFLHQPGYALHEGDAGFDPAISAQGHLIFWVLGLTLSACCGPAQAASRSFLARIIPDGHSGEIFGLYATTGRAISFLTPLLFGITVGIASKAVGGAAASHWGMLAVAAVLLAGFLLLLPVKEKPESMMVSQG